MSIENPNYDSTNDTTGGVFDSTRDTPRPSTGYGGSMECPSICLPSDTVNCFGKSFGGKSILFTLVLIFGLGFIIMIGVEVSHGPDDEGTTIPSSICVDKDCLWQASYIAGLMDTSKNPCTEFSEYACGMFKYNDPISSLDFDLSILDILDYIGEWETMQLLQEPVPLELDNPGNPEWKLKHMYKTCMDEFQNMQEGGNPLIAVLNDLGGLNILGSDPNLIPDFATVLTRSKAEHGSQAFFSMGYAVDRTNANRNLLEIRRGGLGMFQTYYYTRPNYYNDTIVAYKKLMDDLLILLMRDSGITSTNGAVMVARRQKFINDVFDFETKLAQVMQAAQTSSSGTQRPVSELLTLAPPIPWIALFNAVFGSGFISTSSNLAFREATYIANVSSLITESMQADQSQEQLHHYLMWGVIQRYAMDLSAEYVHAVRMFEEVVFGSVQYTTAPIYCYFLTTSVMGEAMSALYVKQWFDETSKSEVDGMFQNIKAAMKAKNSWMSSADQAEAATKLDNTLDKVGYPDWYLDTNTLSIFYQSFNVVDGQFFQTVINTNQFFNNRLRTSIADGVNKDVWTVMPYTARGRYYYAWNEIIFPAGQLQHPLFDINMPRYINYGALGSIIATEMYDAIAGVGANYDSNGLYNPWWDDQTTSNMASYRDCVTDQYRNKTASATIDGVVNPITWQVRPEMYSHVFLSERYGLETTYRAYNIWKQGKAEEKHLPGLATSSIDQHFFLGYAQSRCIQYGQSAVNIMSWLGAAPEDMRIQAHLLNMPEFRSAFNCPVPSDLKVCNLS